MHGEPGAGKTALAHYLPGGRQTKIPAPLGHNVKPRSHTAEGWRFVLPLLESGRGGVRPPVCSLSCRLLDTRPEHVRLEFCGTGVAGQRPRGR